jgi:hypothetical protein
VAGRIGRAAALFAGASFAALVALPVLGQESLLPPGFEQAPPKAAPAPSPAPTPAPVAAPAPRPAPTAAPRPVAPPANGITVATGDPLLPPQEGDVGEEEELEAPPPRYDLPPGSRRLTTRVGPLSEDNGGLAPGAFGNRGRYAVALMDATREPLVSRWSAILLRRALMSGVETPSTVNGPDFVAARAWLLLRQGEAQSARMLVQSVDADKASPRLRGVAMQVFLANADPAGLCPYVPAEAGRGNRSWDLVQAMCAAMVGESGTAGAILERVRRSGRISAIDVKLAEKVIGAGINSRRSATVLWDDVETLTPWRFGLATATGVAIPDNLWRTATPAMRGWAVQAPMISLEQRLPLAPEAAAKGILSARGYVDLVAMAADGESPADDVADLGRAVRLAFVAAELADRVNSISSLMNAERGYAGHVLAARPAARVGPVPLGEDQAFAMLGAMFAGGLDRNAVAWAPRIQVGTPAWGLLAVGSPRPLVGVDAGQVADFASADDSEGGLRTRFLAASLIGLGRVDAGNAADLAEEHDLALNRETRWSRGIALAAERGEAGMVALLVAVGLQGRDWQSIPPSRLYHITAALRRVGLGAEARMIAAEAVTRT